MRNRVKTTVPRIERAGEWLLEAHRTRARFAPLPAELAPGDIGDAYTIQSEFVGKRAETLGQVTGYKIALTTQSMRAMVGLNDSVAGCMMNDAGGTIKTVDAERGLPCADERERIETKLGVTLPVVESMDWTWVATGKR